VDSKWQKYLNKSPTEAELVGLTDNLGLVESVHDLIEVLRVYPPQRNTKTKHPL
jgi:hypothetical protein